jgi:hypothetical protein
MPSFIFLQQHSNDGFLGSEREDKELFGIVRADQYKGFNQSLFDPLESLFFLQ